CQYQRLAVFVQMNEASVARVVCTTLPRTPPQSPQAACVPTAHIPPPNQRSLKNRPPLTADGFSLFQQA
ncbi:hypothetical protein, partial [Neisseria sp. HMSC70E02]|uniref:hypothetical protein n=1 Tax=Neisseria sp. HMSC70E02 TaxID=1608896 RepID=UPI001AF00544